MKRNHLLVGVTAVLLAGCAEGLTRSAETVDVDGFRIKVERVERDPLTYRAFDTSRKNRAMPTSASYARNIIAIRKVSGCPIRPDRITHDKEGSTSRAVVIC